jgi:hypothetical protein
MITPCDRDISAKSDAAPILPIRCGFIAGLTAGRID